MEPHQKVKEACPFCHQEVLEVLTWPGHKAANITRSAIAKNTRWSKKPEGHVLLTAKCPNCGKTANEIQQEWKEAIDKPTVEQKKKKLEELKNIGFSGIIK